MAPPDSTDSTPETPTLRDTARLFLSHLAQAVGELEAKADAASEASVRFVLDVADSELQRVIGVAREGATPTTS
jgi:hypothetical protein